MIENSMLETQCVIDPVWVKKPKDRLNSETSFVWFLTQFGFRTFGIRHFAAQKKILSLVRHIYQYSEFWKLDVQNQERCEIWTLNSSTSLDHFIKKWTLGTKTVPKYEWDLRVRNPDQPGFRTPTVYFSLLQAGRKSRPEVAAVDPKATTTALVSKYFNQLFKDQIREVIKDKKVK